jgi:hypothetical protein
MKQLIYPLSGPVCVSKDERVFKDIMMVFYHYEEAVIKFHPHACTCRYPSPCCYFYSDLFHFGEGDLNAPPICNLIYVYICIARGHSVGEEVCSLLKRGFCPSLGFVSKSYLAAHLWKFMYNNCCCSCKRSIIAVMELALGSYPSTLMKCLLVIFPSTFLLPIVSTSKAIFKHWIDSAMYLFSVLNNFFYCTENNTCTSVMKWIHSFAIALTNLKNLTKVLFRGPWRSFSKCE